MVIDDVPTKEARMSLMGEAYEKIEQAIAQRVWDEFPKRWRDNRTDRRWVKNLAEERCSELDNRLFCPLIGLDRARRRVIALEEKSARQSCSIECSGPLSFS